MIRPLLFCLLLGCAAAHETNTTTAIDSEALAERARSSVVLIRSSDRSGSLGGSGTGFVVREDGVIASNFHVIGQHRAFEVEFADGRTFRPTRILAVDRDRDMALFEIDAKGLPVLELGDSDAVRPGQSIITMGNPLGLEFSVGKGVVAAVRDLDEQEMLQVAVPLEPGSSGSPVLDKDGNVLGILGIKSGDAIGFAVPINQLKPLLENPNPIPFAAWKTIGQLAAGEWTNRFGAVWQQRAGTITATGLGDGIGGRALALRSRLPPASFDLEIDVRLEDEAGAAGLVFCSDGDDRHYGFYPTGGRIRLARFEGPTPFTWNILATVDAPHYRPGRFNRLRVRYDEDGIKGYVNGVLTIETDDKGLKPGQVGLVKFREPASEFRRFRLNKELPPLPDIERLNRQLRGWLSQTEQGLSSEADLLDRLAKLDEHGPEILRQRALDLREEAESMEHLAGRVHRRNVQARLREMTRDPGFAILPAALALAQLDNPDMDAQPYMERMERMAQTVREQLKPDATDEDRLDAVLAHLFDELSFHGSRGDYYNRSNSYLNEVIDDREGLPITLSVLFIELARQVGLDAYGIGIPAHFIAGVQLKDREQLIDPFHGKRITLGDAERLSRRRLDRKDLARASSQDILLRMLSNLLAVAQDENDVEAMFGYLDALLLIDETDGARRGMRAMLFASEGRFDEALTDLNWLLEHRPAGVDVAMVDALRERIAAQAKR